MLVVALDIKLKDLDLCEDIYKSVGKLVFAEPILKDNEAATWREKVQKFVTKFSVLVHGAKHNAEQFERLLKEMCADEEGDLLIESAVKGDPKVFVVSALISVTPAQPKSVPQLPGGSWRLEVWGPRLDVFQRIRIKSFTSNASISKFSFDESNG